MKQQSNDNKNRWNNDKITIKINEIAIRVDEITIKINEITMKRPKKSMKTRYIWKSNNDHWEPDRPEIEKVNKRFKRKW